ncbi:MAG: hypothetical protein A2010_01995 [Nitrospirae bacterium GWD2_57_9]|nr:MAG: hypothetical protein A2010_01995 [Nitrospirae bacterium GWD2_57_9]OGW46024.1 MAG: hypothetical protein A2078_11685 [Nitrospirae bacterium GWC2_57_9]
MKQTKDDRRVERTRKLLHEALPALILEKGYEAVTVQDILDRANLGRSTFYSHYRDKDDLLLKGFDYLRAMMEKQHRSVAGKARGKGAGFNLSLELFRHAQENHRLYKAMVGKRSGQMIIRQAHKYLSGLLKEHIAPLANTKKSAVPVDLTVDWLVSSFLSVLTWWLDRNMPCTAEKIDELFRQLTMPGIQAGLGFELQ